MTSVSAPGAPSIDRLQVLVQSYSITAYKCISKLIDYGLQVRMIVASTRASPNTPDHDLGACKGT